MWIGFNWLGIVKWRVILNTVIKVEQLSDNQLLSMDSMNTCTLTCPLLKKVCAILHNSNMNTPS
jgi:hypothetical protein